MDMHGETEDANKKPFSINKFVGMTYDI